MTRLNAVLLLVLVLSAMALVRISYESRRLFVQLDQAREEEKQLQSDEKRLQALRDTEANHMRVDRDVRAKLGMKLATPDVMLYLPDPAASGGLQ